MKDGRRNLRRNQKIKKEGCGETQGVRGRQRDRRKQEKFWKECREEEKKDRKKKKEEKRKKDANIVKWGAQKEGGGN